MFRSSIRLISHAFINL